MAEDRQVPRDAGGDDTARPGRSAETDQTRRLEPGDDAGTKPGDAGRESSDSGTEPGRGQSAPGDDQTMPLPGGDRTARLPGADQTVPLPASARTPVTPTGGQPARTPGTPGLWLGRAEVPAPGGPAVRDGAPVEWYVSGDDPDRRWWMPILVGIVALLLLALLALGVWLIARSSDEPEIPPSPSVPVSTSLSYVTAEPTTAVPTTGAPRPSATTVTPIVMPSLVGLPQEEARAALDQLGLPYRLRFQSSDQPAGTVIETDPPAGATLTEGEKVTLVIAGSTASPSPTPEPTVPGTPTPAP
jgi:hypothetical protein